MAPAMPAAEAGSLGYGEGGGAPSFRFSLGHEDLSVDRDA
jgi:hypothetical protein